VKITVHPGPLTSMDGPLAILALWQNEALPEALKGLFEASDFTGQAKQMLLLYPRGALPAQRLLLIGLGERPKASLDAIRRSTAQAAQKAQELKATSISLNLPSLELDSPAQVAQAIAEGAELGLYRYLAYKSEPKPEHKHQIEKLQIIVEQTENDDLKALEQGIKVGQTIAKGVILARDLSNAPSNELTPKRLAKHAKELANSHGLKLTVLDKEELKQQGFGGLMAVGQGSAQTPRFIILEYGEAGPDHPTICLVGKGVTFDSGGISIKPAEAMDEMKMDMSGAAAVLGTLQIVSKLKLPLHVVGLIGAAENMPSSTAYKPGDIIRTLSGKTIEVLNTDAEGRIILADALFYAQRYQPAAIIDLATLTGAIMVALGTYAIGLFSNDSALAAKVKQAGETANERVWELPLWDEYRELVKSEIADVKNTAGRYGGSITAAAFLETFVGSLPWVHLDIAGTAWGTGSLQPAKGATGSGVRLLVQLLRDWQSPVS